MLKKLLAVLQELARQLQELIPFDRGSNHFYLKVLLTLLILCKSIQVYQSRPMKFYYNSDHRLMKAFLEKSRIRQTVFRPHFLLLWHATQTFVYCVAELLSQRFLHEKFDDEFIKTADGGTVGIAWAYDKGTKSGRPTGKRGQKPILLLCPGLGGGIYNLYTTALMRYARRRGYKVGTVYFRCTEGIPVTSPKLNYAGSWDDLKVVVEHVHNKYILDKQTGQKKTRMYAFGCSLGAIILALYMAFEGDRATKYLDGAVLYATPWNTRDGFDFFCNNFYGLYSWAIGVNLNRDIRDKVLPRMKHLLSEEDYDYYKQTLDTNTTGLPVLDS